MEENKGKLFVFDKKEVVLIFFFMLLIAVTAFTLGVRVGKGLFLKSEDVSLEDFRSLEMKSAKEEEIESLVRDAKPLPAVELINEYSDRLDEEIERTTLDDLDLLQRGETESLENEFEESLKNISMVKEEENNETYSGKWTAQLVSFPDRESAIEFANGFVARGYNPVINAVEIQGRGTWYRVSLGLFNSKRALQTFINENSTIFSGKEYQIYQIK